MVNPLRWPIGHGVTAVFSTKQDGDMREPALREPWLATLGIGQRRIAIPRQVHGIRIAIDPADKEDMDGSDGIVSRDPQVVLGAYGADCPALVIATPDAIGIAHCGWRGTAGGIVGALAEALRTVTRNPPNLWRALVGPGISADRYEVDAPVLNARAWPKDAILRPREGGKADLNLAAAIRADCQTAGIGSVHRIGVCTASDERLHSFRHHGPGLVQVMVVWKG